VLNAAFVFPEGSVPKLFSCFLCFLVVKLVVNDFILVVNDFILVVNNEKYPLFPPEKPP